jgi:hypothetical protein
MILQNCFLLNWNDLSSFGQFVGGISSSGALFFIMYSLVVQQNEFNASISNLNQQSENLNNSNETQTFNLLYSALLHRSEDFTYPKEGSITEHGVSALRFMVNAHLGKMSSHSLEPLRRKKSSIEAFLNTYFQTLKFINGITNIERKDIFEHYNQFKKLVDQL